MTADLTIISPSWIAPVEPAGVLLKDHSVVLRGALIEAVLPSAEAAQRYAQAERVELPEHLLIPGLINLHTHASMALLRGVGDDLPLERWLHERIWPLEAKLVSPEFVYDGALMAASEMLKCGVTCFNDMYFFPEQVARAADALGMRASLGIITVEFPTVYGSGPEDYLRKGLALRDELAGESRFSFTFSPHAPYTVSDASFRRIAVYCAELGLPICCHVHETRGEIEQAITQTGVRPLARLDALGIVGPELVAVHAVHLTDSEIELLAKRGASVAHCPHSNLKLGSGIARIDDLLAAGVNIGIGTDGSASNNRLDLLGEARSAALLAKGTSGRADAFNAHQLLHAMTLGAAQALGLAERIGSIAPGKCADLVAIDMSAPELTPAFDPVSHLAYAAGREHVTAVWVDGANVAFKRQLVASRARQAASDVTARLRIWQNRINEVLTVDLAGQSD